MESEKSLKHEYAAAMTTLDIFISKLIATKMDTIFYC